MDAPLNLQNIKSGLSKLTIREQVSHRLAAMVQAGILRTGDELPSERELAATLEVSRETVRGAIQMLAAIGMVEISQGSRTRIARTEGFSSYNSVTQPVLSGQSADQVYHARLMIELPVIRTAVECIDDDGIARLRRLVDAQREMLEDTIRFQISDAEFHDAIYQASGNELVAGFLRQLFSFGMEYRRHVLLRQGSVSLSLADHIDILDGFEQRDPTAAAEAMQHHLDRIHRTTLEAIAETSVDRR
ncbi:MAG: FadR family transcriptional regulator [Alphaproteobacteria bacterium]|nr:FadR family transcriptional regulator [Alphaproteobacteria bacterium]MBU1560158.1 FadR family transcriptional regulator [Alphaproteobacteria bacterium]MBU2301896.1 FadR family transcriptional regulator [Alphaproteobacteria bacterium]MBU2367120.1 FadR family transcriptional regulator [Alphaproteobacteria bacterium]